MLIVQQLFGGSHVSLSWREIAKLDPLFRVRGFLHIVHNVSQNRIFPSTLLLGYLVTYVHLLIARQARLPTLKSQADFSWLPCSGGCAGARSSSACWPCRSRRVGSVLLSSSSPRMGILGDLYAAIPEYTGLSQVTFFTILALVFAVYYLLKGILAPPVPHYVRVEPPPPPVQLGDVTAEELLEYDGRDASKPLLMAIKGQVYDVSYSRTFYGPGGPYALFAGKDASRALAKMSFEEKDLTGDIEGLTPYELDALTDWEFKFESKYVKVGRIVPGGAARETSKEEPVQPEPLAAEDVHSKEQ